MRHHLVCFCSYNKGGASFISTLVGKEEYSAAALPASVESKSTAIRRTHIRDKTITFSTIKGIVPCRYTTWEALAPLELPFLSTSTQPFSAAPAASEDESGL